MAEDGKFGRRQFLAGAAAAATFTIVPRHVLGGKGNVAPSGKLNIAAIGIGGMGATNLKALETENIVALCDVDMKNYAAKTAAKYPKARKYTDFRVMLEKQKNIDAVLIATPDHTHAVLTMACLKAGKHVYTQKPLCHNIWEARELTKAAKELNLVTQMGIQGHSGEGVRIIKEWLAAGILGEIREVDAWCYDTYYPWGHAGWSPTGVNGEAPKTKDPLPEGMNWDLWIGPAKMRPYNSVYHPMKWRCWLDFGNGWMGDRGVHTLDPVVNVLELGPPLSVDATTCGLTKEMHPLAAINTFRFAERKGMPPVKVTWYEGTRPPRPEELEDGRSLDKTGGVIFKGSKATVTCGVYAESPRIIPEAKMKALKDSLPAPSIPRIPGGMTGGHEQDWVRAIKEGGKAGADFAYSGPLTELCLLGNVARRVDTRITWDAEAMKVTNVAEANKYIREEYREGWSL